MVPLYYLSFTCRSTPHRRAHKKAVLPTPGLFIERSYAAVSFNNLCTKQREPDLHCINKKKNRDTRTTGAIVSYGHKYFAHYTQKKNTIKS